MYLSVTPYRVNPSIISGIKKNSVYSLDIMARSLNISKTLEKEGFKPEQAKALESVLSDIFRKRDKEKSTSSKNDDLARKSDVEICKLELQKEIEQVRSELTVKIEKVRKEISDSKTEVQKSITSQNRWFMGLITAYTALIISLKFFN